MSRAVTVGPLPGSRKAYRGDLRIPVREIELTTGQVVERLAQALLYTTADKAEGASAFLEKRPPAFQGV